MTGLESYVTWAACTNRRHIFVWSCWCSGSKPTTHLLLGGWLRGAQKSCEQLGKERVLVTCQMISCSAGNMNSSPPPSVPFCSPRQAYVSKPEVLFAFLPHNPFTFILSLGPPWCHEVLKCEEELRVDLSLRRLQWRHEWVQMVLLHLHQYFKYFFSVLGAISNHINSQQKPFLYLGLHWRGIRERLIYFLLQQGVYGKNQWWTVKQREGCCHRLNLVLLFVCVTGMSAHERTDLDSDRCVFPMRTE